MADLIERYEASGVDQVIFVSQAGANRHDHVCESLELFASDVLPRFAERAPEREQAKVERLGSAMERAFVPEQARGFEGDIRYELRGRDGPRSWTLRIRDGQAAARRGAGAEPALTLRASVPDFVRMAAGEEFAPKLLLEGALVIEGDFALAGRLAEMFGERPPT